MIAIRQFRAPVLSIGAEGQFTVRSKSKAGTSIMMGTAGDGNLETNVVMFAASRTDWSLQSGGVNGRLKAIVAGEFAHPLELNRSYQFILSCTANTVTITGPGLDVSRSLPTPVSPGAYGFWRVYPERPPAGRTFDFDKVWALENGLPAVPIPTSAVGTEH